MLNEKQKENFKKYLDFVKMEKEKDLKYFFDKIEKGNLNLDRIKKSYKVKDLKIKRLDTFNKFTNEEKENYLKEYMKVYVEKQVKNLIEKYQDLFNLDIEILEISNTVEWQYSKTWGYNPKCTTELETNKEYIYLNASASGCGYDKLSACINSSLYENKIWKKMIVEKVLNDEKFNLLKKDWLPYGLHIDSYGIYAEFGGCGISTYEKILKYLGFDIVLNKNLKMFNYILAKKIEKEAK